MNSVAQFSTSTDDALTAAQTIARLTAQTTRHDVDIDGNRVCWRSLGQGSPLVLIHGGHGSWLHWVRNIETLSRQHTVWVPDLPSYGDSGTLGAPGTLDQLVAVTAASLDQLLGEGVQINLAGFSFGGLVASRLAQHRGHVGKLALVGTGGHGTARRQTLSMVNWRRSDDESIINEDLRHNLSALMLYEASSIDELALAVHRNSCTATRFRSKSLSQKGPLPDILRGFSMPILFIWGEHDVTGHPDQLGPLLIDQRPERDWVSIPGAGHWVQFEQTERCNQVLLQFFD